MTGPITPPHVECHHSAPPTANRPVTTSARRAAVLAAVLAAVTAACGASEAPDGGDVYRVEIEACAGRSEQRATAMAVAPDLVASAGHTFESARGVILKDAEGGEVSAHLVYLDLDTDIALLAVEPTASAVFELAPDVADDTEVRIRSYADSEGVEVSDGTVVRTVSLTLDGAGRRTGLELATDIELGESGAPVIDADGRAVGMVFASSRTAERGWAVASVELEEALTRLGDSRERILVCADQQAGDGDS